MGFPWFIVLKAKLLHVSQKTSSGSMPFACRRVTWLSMDPPVAEVLSLELRRRACAAHSGGLANEATLAGLRPADERSCATAAAKDAWLVTAVPPRSAPHVPPFCCTNVCSVRMLPESPKMRAAFTPRRFMYTIQETSWLWPALTPANAGVRVGSGVVKAV